MAYARKPDAHIALNHVDQNLDFRPSGETRRQFRDLSEQNLQTHILATPSGTVAKPKVFESFTCLGAPQRLPDQSSRLIPFESFLSKLRP